METFTSGSASASCRAARMAPRSSLLRALRFSGRFMVSRRTPGRGASITSTFAGITLLLWIESVTLEPDEFSSENHRVQGSIGRQLFDAVRWCSATPSDSLGLAQKEGI